MFNLNMALAVTSNNIEWVDDNDSQEQCTTHRQVDSRKVVHSLQKEDHKD